MVEVLPFKSVGSRPPANVVEVPDGKVMSVVDTVRGIEYSFPKPGPQWRYFRHGGYDSRGEALGQWSVNGIAFVEVRASNARAVGPQGGRSEPPHEGKVIAEHRVHEGASICVPRVKDGGSFDMFAPAKATDADVEYLEFRRPSAAHTYFRLVEHPRDKLVGEWSIDGIRWQ